MFSKRYIFGGLVILSNAELPVEAQHPPPIPSLGIIGLPTPRWEVDLMALANIG